MNFSSIENKLIILNLLRQIACIYVSELFFIRISLLLRFIDFNVFNFKLISLVFYFFNHQFGDDHRFLLAFVLRVLICKMKICFIIFLFNILSSVSSNCDKFFEYEILDGESYGRISFPVDDIQNTEIKVILTVHGSYDFVSIQRKLRCMCSICIKILNIIEIQDNIGELNVIKIEDATQHNITKQKLVILRLSFPIQDPRPIIFKIYNNNKMICSTFGKISINLKIPF